MVLQAGIIAIFSIYHIVNGIENKCPEECIWEQPRTKLRCNGQLWQDLKNPRVFSELAYMQQLDLSKNRIAKLDYAFLQISSLKKIVLSENKIRVINEDAFINLTALTTLDLNGNNIAKLPIGVFASLHSLERLKLRSNQLKSLDDGIFLNQKKMRMLELSDNPWHCDCFLIWITEWIKTNNIKFQTAAKCSSPTTQSGNPIKKLDYACLNVDGLELEPAQDQIVFAGDSLLLRCRGDDNTNRVRWMWHNIDPLKRFSHIDVMDRTHEDDGIVESYIKIDKLEPEHSGDWVCQKTTGKNSSATVSVLVLSNTTKYCPSTISRDNKGVYFWPRTVLGHGAELPCAGERVGKNPGSASYHCSPEGEWEDLDTSACSYTSETTRRLQQFVEDDLSTSQTSMVDKAEILLNISNDVVSLTDPIDLIFISQTVRKYCNFLDEAQDLSELLTDIIAGMQNIPIGLLSLAEKDGKACKLFRDALEEIFLVTPNYRAQKALLAVEVFTVQPEAFTGMSCAWRQPDGARHLHCNTSPRAVLDAPGRDLLAFVELPISLFTESRLPVYKLFVSMFSNGHLFPDGRYTVDEYTFSNVVGIKIQDPNGLELGNLTEPIALMISAPPKGALTEAVRWDAELANGSGGWTTDGCVTSQFTRDHLLFHCHKLGYYCVKQKHPIFQLNDRTVWGVATLYSGSCVLLACLLVAIGTYATSFETIQMSRRAKHAIVNTWISIFILCFLFTFGVFATDDVKVCEGLGLMMHYFSLSTLLWMVVAANQMYKRLSRCAPDHSTDDLPAGAPMPKPILGLYLVGWGIGIIVCGISGAVHLRDYAQTQYCFLGAGPALSAVLVPTGMLLVILFIFYFLTFCAIRNSDVNGQQSEGTQGTEHVDLEFLEDATGIGGILTERRSAKSEITDSDEVEDSEHSPIIQLKAHVIVLIMFLMSWLLAALIAVSEVYIVMPYQEPLANCGYCIVAFFFGAFTLYFYCVARSDVRARWTMALSPRYCCRSRNVSDTHASLPLQPTTIPVNNRPPSVNSAITGRSSSSHRTKAVLELNNCDTSDSISMQCKPNCVNLVAMHRQIYRSNNSMPTYQEISNQNVANAFYNPRQSVVAKKFFKKQRRHRRNELGVRRRGDGGGTSEGEMSQCHRTWRPSAESAVFLSSDMENNSEKLAPNIFGYGSKINNTNIHVGQNSRKKDINSPKNPNMLSEEGEDKKSEKQLLARLVIGAEECASGGTLGPNLTSVDEESPTAAPECRSVQLQCSLDDSSDAPDIDDSFCQKIDSLQLVSDDSCVERLACPPQYVTVLDPKYGVVKVTMSDFNQQSYRLSLASSGEFQPMMGLPSTPEEYLDDLNEHQSCVADSASNQKPDKNDSKSNSSNPSPHSVCNTSVSCEKRIPPNSLNLLAKNYSPQRSRHRRSLPSSPVHQNHDHRRSLPSSPEGNSCSRGETTSTNANPRRESPPKLTLPPPPDFPATSDEGTAESGGEQPDLSSDNAEQWQKPEPPTSPSCHRSERPKPISDELLLDRKKRLSLSPDDSLQEPKKETSV